MSCQSFIERGPTRRGYCASAFKRLATCANSMFSMCFDDGSAGGELGLERIVLRPFGLKCTPLDDAPQNEVGERRAQRAAAVMGDEKQRHKQHL